MLLRNACFAVAVGAAGAASAAVEFYNSTGFIHNTTVRGQWLAAIGISSGSHMVDFEGYANGLNLHGQVLEGGLSVLAPSGEAITRSSHDFFGGSNPIGEMGLALTETSGAANAIRITFASPVDYIGGYVIDMPSARLWVNLTDGSTLNFGLNGTASTGDSAEFWGVWRNDMSQIASVEFRDTSGGDGEWGLDNLELGVVPEPATLLAVGLGALAVIRRRR